MMADLRSIVENEDKPDCGWALFCGVDNNVVLVWAPNVSCILGKEDHAVLVLNENFTVEVSADALGARRTLDAAHRKWRAEQE